MPSIVGAMKDPLFWRDLANNAIQASAGMTAGTIGAPVDIMTTIMRPFGYSVPAEGVVGSSDWIGRMLAADRGSLPYRAGQFGVTPEPTDAMRAAPMLLGMMKRLPRRVGSAKVRAARAKEMGFDDETVYHGTAGDFTSFDLSRGGATSQSMVGQLGVSVTDDPEVASEFASLAARAGVGESVMPLRIRATKRGVIELDGTETDLEIAATVQDAWGQGFDAIKFLNYTTPSGKTGRSLVLVRDPSQIRSVHAEFDPTKKLSPNLLAGGAALAMGLGLSQRDER